MPPELTALSLAALLQVAQTMLVNVAAMREAGIGYNIGNRDTEPAFSPRLHRLRRALSNHAEALPLFAVAILVAELAGATGPLTAACAWIYLGARLLFVPAYAFGWVPWRSIFWGIGLTATLVILLVTVL